MTFNLTLVLRKHNCWLSSNKQYLWVYDFRAWIFSFLHALFIPIFLLSILLILSIGKANIVCCVNTLVPVAVVTALPGWQVSSRCCHTAAADTCQWLPDCQHIASRLDYLLTMPVSCYICGRDFGTKSITIHIPNCIKKWDNEQKKLPKSQRRPPPSAPVNLDKVISGELKGEELNKFNGEVLQEWNDTALVPCDHCGRFCPFIM